MVDTDICLDSVAMVMYTETQSWEGMYDLLRIISCHSTPRFNTVDSTDEYGPSSVDSTEEHGSSSIDSTEEYGFSSIDSSEDHGYSFVDSTEEYEPIL